jgi:hypothetical protein
LASFNTTLRHSVCRTTTGARLPSASRQLMMTHSSCRNAFTSPMARRHGPQSCRMYMPAALKLRATLLQPHHRQQRRFRTTPQWVRCRQCEALTSSTLARTASPAAPPTPACCGWTSGTQRGVQRWGLKPPTHLRSSHQGSLLVRRHIGHTRRCWHRGGTLRSCMTKRSQRSAALTTSRLRTLCRCACACTLCMHNASHLSLAAALTMRQLDVYIYTCIYLQGHGLHVQLLQSWCVCGSRC